MVLGHCTCSSQTGLLRRSSGVYQAKNGLNIDRTNRSLDRCRRSCCVHAAFKVICNLPAVLALAGVWSRIYPVSILVLWAELLFWEHVVARIWLIENFERNYTRGFNLLLEVVVLPWIWWVGFAVVEDSEWQGGSWAHGHPWFCKIPFK
jgi:hypothetical protein